MSNEAKLKSILTEWLERKIPPLYTRDFDSKLMAGDEILSIIGARRSGKTYLCFQLIQQLQQEIPRTNIFYINFEDERLYPLLGDELTLLLPTCLELADINPEYKIYLFVDEIQNVANWSKWARRITESNRHLKLIITGSSAKLLSREIATELRGRTLSFTCYPMSFKEYIRAHTIEVDNKNLLHSERRIPIKKLFNKYLKSGGFPATINNPNASELLKEYYNAMFYRDIIERHRIVNTSLLADYLTLLIDQTGCTFTISATAKKLNNIGYSFSKNTLSNFLNYAEDAFMVFTIKKYAYKIKEQLHAPKKIYAIDHGLIQAIRFTFSENYGRLLENIVYLQLQRQKQSIYYHSQNKECDFITTENKQVTGAIQVTQNMGNEKTQKRELAGLVEAMEQYKLNDGLILTEDTYVTKKINKANITILPIWYWLLL